MSQSKLCYLNYTYNITQYSNVHDLIINYLGGNFQEGDCLRKPASVDT